MYIVRWICGTISTIYVHIPASTSEATRKRQAHPLGGRKECLDGLTRYIVTWDPYSHTFYPLFPLAYCHSNFVHIYPCNCVYYVNVGGAQACVLKLGARLREIIVWIMCYSHVGNLRPIGCHAGVRVGLYYSSTVHMSSRSMWL